MKEIKFGIFGLWRGGSFLPIIRQVPGCRVTAVCEKNEETLKWNEKEIRERNIRVCSDFDELLDSGIDAVFLCNYFHQHAPYAVRAFEKGVAVISECTAASTLKECAELCDAYEKYGGKYMLAENYPYTAARLEMEKRCQDGTFGKILYAEGEYNHSGSRDMLKDLTPGPNHWRAHLARTYYCTHALGPLMYSTKQVPVQVSAYAVSSPELKKLDDFRHNTDGIGMLNCLTDGGALFRFTGCTAMASPSGGYRICGDRGGIETGRSLGDQVQLFYHSWLAPEGVPSNQIYTPDFPEEYRDAVNAGHGGGDYVEVCKFADYLRTGELPFFDVYKACAMSACGILGWRSCLEKGKPYAIPDFRDKAQRDAVRSDDLTPFPDEDGKATLPCRTED